MVHFHDYTMAAFYSTLDELYVAYASGGCNMSEVIFNEGITETLEIPDTYRRHFDIALTNWRNSLFHLISDKEKNILKSYLRRFEDARKTKIANIQKEFFDSIQAGDVDTFKRLYKSYACDMHHVNKTLLEGCLQSTTDHVLEFYVTERFESMSNLFKYFSSDMSDAQIIRVIAKCHGWNADLVNDKVRSIMKTAIAKQRHLFAGQDAPHYIKEFIDQQ